VSQLAANPYNSQYSCDETRKVLAAVGNSEPECNVSMDIEAREDNDIISAWQSHVNKACCSLCIAPILAVTTPGSVVSIDSQTLEENSIYREIPALTKLTYSGFDSIGLVEH
jgi:hypothetical protein